MTLITIPYSPRYFQSDIHDRISASRWSVVVLHRRAGKSVMLINHLIREAMTCQKQSPRFAYVAPFLKQAKQLAWDYFKQFCEPLPDVRYHESELKIDLPNGARIRLYGADNAEALRGIYLDGVVLDEYATIDPGVFTSILRPALSDRKGWGVFSGTPNGRNHFHDLFVHASENHDKGWFSILLKASDTGVLNQTELDDARKLMTKEEYDREFECSWDSVIGKRIYPEFKRSLHVSNRSLLPDPEIPHTIYRGWDNTGLSPAIVLTYLTNTGQWRVFKEFCFFDTAIMDATEAMVLWCNQNLHPQTKYVDYADPAGRNRDSTKMSPRDYIMLKSREMGQDVVLIDGIQTWKVRRESVANRLTKLVNGESAILIDPCCKRLVEGFDGAYAFKEFAGLPGQYKEEPVKNDSSHIADALQYIATRLFTHMERSHTGELLPGISQFEDDFDDDYTYHPSETGRSAIGGY